MVFEVVEVGLVEKQYLAVEEMKVDYADIVGKEKTIGKDMDRTTGMLDFHENILANFEQLVLVWLRKPSFPRHRCIP